MPVTEKEAVHALPGRGWLRRYVIHGVRQTTAPLAYHIGVGITILAVTCPLAYGMHYAGTLRTNQFCLLVGRSGEDQKSTAVNVGKEILDQAASPLVGDFPGSPEGLLESLQRTPSQMIPIPEFGKFLSAAQRGYFEPIKTALADLWDCLDEETEILAPSGWKRMGQVQVGDIVWALDPDSGMLVRSKVLAVGSRPVRPEERMVRLKGHNHDIRTTEGHRYYIKYRDPGHDYEPSRTCLVRTGSEMVSRKSAYHLPFSAEPNPTDAPGVGLTDDELRFIAWFITDGTLPKVRSRRLSGGWSRRLSIAQSESKYTGHIRQLLSRLGLDWREHRMRSTTEYKESAPIIRFAIPRGTGRGTKKRNGWVERFESYLDKDLAPSLMKMNKHQFSVFWSELLLGDGEQVDGRSGLLWSVRKTLIDRLQQLAVELGFSTQYGIRALPSGKTGYRMSINDRRWVCTAPGNPRSVRFEFENSRPDEQVWCATTEHGTLVTRRNGKVIILGNCGPTQRARANGKIIRVDHPRLSISAACSVPYLERHTLSEDWTGGFMGRWMVMYGMRERTDPNPIGDRSDLPWLVSELQRRAMLPSAGWCMGLDPASQQIWNAWYYDISNRQLPGNIVGIRARAPTIARKIALLLGWDYGPAELGQPWLITPDILEPAIRIAELHVKSLVDLSDVIAEHTDARLRRSVLTAISQQGGTANLGQILSILKMKKKPVVESLDGLIEEGRVKREATTLGTNTYIVLH